jgi:hypothetical protein
VTAAAGLMVMVMLAAPANAQDRNVVFPVAEVETRLASTPFSILEWRGSRAVVDRTHRVVLAYEDGSSMIAKWATAPPNGTEFNNEPRYELAAYVVQQFFLDPDEYVVPPTVIRAIPLGLLREQVPQASATFAAAPRSALVCLQYWLSAVTPDNFWDRERARTDSLYARYVGNFNILTYVIRHSDANVGNYLISQDAERPRVFVVDNGVAFESLESQRGTQWRGILVERLPRSTIERLRGITREQLVERLGVLAEFEIRDGTLVPVTPGPNLSRGRGVRSNRRRIQFGLTETEIRGVERRIQTLISQADAGRYPLF